MTSRPSKFERELNIMFRLQAFQFTDDEVSAILGVYRRVSKSFLTLYPLLAIGTALNVAEGMSRIAGDPKRGKAAEDKAVLVAAIERLSKVTP